MFKWSLDWHLVLVFIADEESALSVASQRGTNAKKSYVPRRLVIGNDEYVDPIF